MADDEKLAFGTDDVIAGKYRLVRLLGRGAMGEVFEATCDGSITPVKAAAIKILNPGLLTETGALPRFESEIKILRKLNHPHVARILDAGVTDPTPACPSVPFFAMELLSGKTLKHVIRRYRKRMKFIPPILIYGLARDLFRGLAYIHKCGVVHRDLKPDNVFVLPLGPFSIWKIGDFGVSKLLEGSAWSTGLGGYVGTPRYSSKQQFLGHRPTPAFDMFSAGVLLFQMATLLTPWFDVKDENDLVAAICVQEPVAPRIEEFRGDVSPRATELIRQCLSHNPAERSDAESAAQLFSELYVEAEKQLGFDVQKTYTDFGTTIEEEEQGIPVPEERQDVEDAEFLKRLEVEGTTAKAGPKDTHTMGPLFTARGTLRMWLESFIAKSFFGLTAADLPTQPSRRGNDNPTAGRPRLPMKGGTAVIPPPIPGSIAANNQAYYPSWQLAIDTTPAPSSLTPSSAPNAKVEPRRGQTLILLRRSSLATLAILATIGAGFAVKKRVGASPSSYQMVNASLQSSPLPPSTGEVTTAAPVASSVAPPSAVPAPIPSSVPPSSEPLQTSPSPEVASMPTGSTSAQVEPKPRLRVHRAAKTSQSPHAEELERSID